MNFIFNRDMYDFVIEKVDSYHSLVRLFNLYSWPKNCGVYVEGPYNVHKTLGMHKGPVL